jgi:hypothetical protein
MVINDWHMADNYHVDNGEEMDDYSAGIEAIQAAKPSGREDSNYPPKGSPNSAKVHQRPANKGLVPSSLPLSNSSEHSQTSLNFNLLLHTHYTRIPEIRRTQSSAFCF